MHNSLSDSLERSQSVAVIREITLEVFVNFLPDRVSPIAVDGLKRNGQKFNFALVAPKDWYVEVLVAGPIFTLEGNQTLSEDKVPE